MRKIVLILSLVFVGVMGVSFVARWDGGEYWKETQTRKGADLYQHYAAGRMVREGKTELLYRDSHLLRWIQKGEAPKYHFNYVYSPLIAKIAACFAGEHYIRFYIGWLIFSLACVIASIYFLKHIAPDIKFLPVYILGFPSTAYSLILGQLTPLSLLLVSIAGFAFKRNHAFAAGFFLSCLCYKPQLLPFLALILALMGWWKVFGGMMLGGLIWLGATILAGGWNLFIDWANVLLGMGAGIGQSQNWSLNITWLGFFWNFGWKLNAFLWLGTAMVPLALIAVWIRLKNLPKPEALFGNLTFCLPFLPYALSYELLLTTPAFLLFIKNTLPSKGLWLLSVLWWFLALWSHQPINNTFTFIAPVITLLWIACLLKVNDPDTHL
ncbi:MAG: glycosyltransferase family 87 protein [Verrucomicrobiota bacterium]